MRVQRLLTILFLLLPLHAIALESLSYSGRLVNANGSPVTGSPNIKFELAYTNDLGNPKCSKTIPVNLTNGVFHAKLEFLPGECTTALTSILQNVPGGQSVALKITDLTNSKAYSWQALHSMPFSIISNWSNLAKNLEQNGATNGQVLKWNGTTWAPGTDNGGALGDGGVTTVKLADGAVTDTKVAAGAAIARSKLAAGTPNTIVVNDGSGVMNSLTILPTSLGGTGLSVAGVSNQLLGMNNAGNSMEYKTPSAVSPLILTHGAGTMALSLDTVPVTKGGTGLTSFTPNRILGSNTLGTGLVELGCGADQVLSFDAIGDIECKSVAHLSNAYIKDGNSFGAAAVLGTNDNYPIHFETNGSNRVTILADGKVGIGNSSPTAALDITSTNSGILIPRMTTALRDTITAPANGLQIYNTTTNKINYYNGTSWQELGAGSGSGTVTSIVAGSGLTGGTITSTGTISVDTGTTANKIVQLDGTAKLPVVDGSALTNLNPSNLSTAVPIAKGGTGLTATGAINQILGMNSTATAIEYKTITAGTGMSVTHAAGTVTLATTGAPPTGAASGDLSGTYPSPTVAKIQGTAVSGTAPASGQMLIYDGTTAWMPRSISGDASLSSTGVLTLGTVPVSKGGTGATSFAANKLIGSSVTGNSLQVVSCPQNQVMSFTITGEYTCTSLSGLISAFLQDGNSFGGAATLGTNDNYSLNFKTNGSNRMVIGTTGYVGIGVTSPAQELHIKSPAGNGDIRLEASDGPYLDYFAGSTATGYSGIWAFGANNHLSLATNGIEKMRILTSGNVGIGTSSPGTTLDVRGNLTIESGGNPTIYTGTGVVELSRYLQLTNSSGAATPSGLKAGGILVSDSFTYASPGKNDLIVKGNVGIGNPTPSAVLDITSTTSGILIPRMTSAQRDAITTPATGLQIYNTSTNKPNYYNGTIWQEVGAGGGSGTVTSVVAGTGLIGGPITSTGTLAVDTGTTASKIVQLDVTAKLPAVDGSQLTNLNPANLSEAVPVNKGGTGLAAFSPNRIIASDTLGLSLQQLTCGENEILTFTILGAFVCKSLSTMGGFVNNGNSFAGAATIGTMDAFPLHFETANTTRMTILSDGKVGIGVTPTATFHVYGPPSYAYKLGGWSAVQNTPRCSCDFDDSTIDCNTNPPFANELSVSCYDWYSTSWVDPEFNPHTNYNAQQWDVETFSGLVFKDGTLGVNTSNPMMGHKLHVEGSSYMNGSMMVTGNANLMGSANIMGNTSVSGTASFFSNLNVSGEAYKPGGGTWADSSDKRLKKNIRPMGEGALEKILLLEPVTYEWKNPSLHGAKSGEIITGFIAQDVEKVFPGWVGTNEPKEQDKALIPKGEKAKNLGFPHDFNAYVVKAMQEMNEKMEALEAENRELKEAVCEINPRAKVCQKARIPAGSRRPNAGKAHYLQR